MPAGAGPPAAPPPAGPGAIATLGMLKSKFKICGLMVFKIIHADMTSRSPQMAFSTYSRPLLVPAMESDVAYVMPPKVIMAKAMTAATPIDHFIKPGRYVWRFVVHVPLAGIF